MIGRFAGSLVKAGMGREGAWNGLSMRIRALARTLLRQMAMSLLMGAIVPLPGLSKQRANPTRQPEAPNVWRARYMAGTLTVQKRGETVPLAEESRVRVRFEEDRILVFQKKRLVSIPAAAVSELDYRAEVFSRSRKVFGKEGAAQALSNCVVGSGQAGVACVFLGVPLYAATAPFHYREHIVHITWRTGASTSGEYDDTDQEMELRVGKGEFRGLIGALERATGKKCERIERSAAAR